METTWRLVATNWLVALVILVEYGLIHASTYIWGVKIVFKMYSMIQNWRSEFLPKRTFFNQLTTNKESPNKYMSEIPLSMEK